MSGCVLFQERNGIRFRSLTILAARAPSSVNSGCYGVCSDQTRTRVHNLRRS